MAVPAATPQQRIAAALSLARRSLAWLHPKGCCFDGPFSASRCASVCGSQHETTITLFDKCPKRMIASIYSVGIYAIAMSVAMSSIASSTNELQSDHWMLSNFPTTLLATTPYPILSCSFGPRRARNMTDYLALFSGYSISNPVSKQITFTNSCRIETLIQGSSWSASKPPNHALKLPLLLNI